MSLAQIESGQISLLQLFRPIVAGSVEPEKLSCYIEFDVSRLVIESTENPYIYLHRSTIDRQEFELAWKLSKIIEQKKIAQIS